MIPDVAVTAADRDVLRVRLPIRFHLVFLALDQFRCLFQVCYGVVEFADRNIAVPAMPVHAVIFREFLNTLCIDFNRATQIAGIGGASPIPDDVVGGVRSGFVISLCLCELIERLL